MKAKMNNKRNVPEDQVTSASKGNPKANGRRPQNKSGKGRRNNSKGSKETVDKLDTSRGNNPAWYFKDEHLADQVSQMSFQNLAGFPINYDGFDFDVPNIVNVFLNPAPGVTVSKLYNTALAQNSSINLAGFRLYSKLSAFTGRVQSYAPQDVSTMILAMGELISTIECVRRMFGVAYTMNMRNRDYPKQILEFGMLVDADDLFQHLSDYRTQFNTLITLVNQLPIPKNCAYFNKCARIYEKVYLDSPSAMAQTIIPFPWSTWILDEASYSGGSILKTVTIPVGYPNLVPQTMAYYLNMLASLIGALLNSSTLQIVYTDLMNYASKKEMEFWRFDYLFEEYIVVPEYDINFLLQMHNATVTYIPNVETQFYVSTNAVVTPENDVYPDVNRNCLFYNPAFLTYASVANGHARTGDDNLIDMLTDAPTVTDRIECTRYASNCKGTRYQPTGQSIQNAYIDTALPDHYVVSCRFETQTSNLTEIWAGGTVIGENQFRDISAFVSNIDWAPRFFEIATGTQNYTGRYTSDLNFYTLIDHTYLRKLHDFVGLALYDI